APTPRPPRRAAIRSTRGRSTKDSASASSRGASSASVSRTVPAGASASSGVASWPRPTATLPARPPPPPPPPARPPQSPTPPPHRRRRRAREAAQRRAAEVSQNLAHVGAGGQEREGKGFQERRRPAGRHLPHPRMRRRLRRRPRREPIVGDADAPHEPHALR